MTDCVIDGIQNATNKAVDPINGNNPIILVLP